MTTLTDVFMVDPPWPKKKGGIRSVRPNQTKTLDYSTLLVPDIFALLDKDVFSQAAPIHAVFLWGIDQFLHAGEQAMLDRGYRMHARFVWDKENGVAPAFSIRYCHEYLSWFYRPSFMPVAKDVRGKFSTVIRERAREHSRKPDAAYRLVEALYPDAARLDVFSRQPRVGWEQFGDQPTCFKAVA